MSESQRYDGTGAATPPQFQTAESQPFTQPEHRKPQAPVKKAKTPRQVPPGAIVPDRGWPKVKYWFWKNGMLPAKRFPAINVQQHHEVVRSGSTAELRSLTDTVPELTVAFWNTKGASATTTTTVISTAVLAEISRATTVLVDGNPAAGTCAARYGLDYGETVTTQELASGIRKDEELAHRDFKSQINRARPSRNGVRVVSADSIIEESKRLDGVSMRRVLELMGHNSEYLAVDTGNDIGNTASKAVAAFVDVFVFTANVGVPDSLRKLSTSMETLRRAGFEDKVNHSVVVISNLPKGRSLDDYRMFLNTVSFEDKVTAKLEHKFEGQFLGVPHDAYVALDRIVDLDKLEWEVLQAYIAICTAILQQSPKMRSSSATQLGGGFPPADD